MLRVPLAQAEFFWLHNTDHRKSEVEHPPDAKVWEKSTCASRYGSTKALREEDLPVVTMLLGIVGSRSANKLAALNLFLHATLFGSTQNPKDI